MKRTFEQWFAAVDAEVKATIGMSVKCLPDCPFYDWYNAKVSPKTAAKRAIKGLME